MVFWPKGQNRRQCLLWAMDIKSVVRSEKIWDLAGSKKGFFSPSDAIADSNPINTPKRIRLKCELQSDGSCRVNRMRRRLSIRCAFAFQSIETFFGFLTWFFGPKGKVDANVFRNLKDANPGVLPFPTQQTDMTRLFKHPLKVCLKVWGTVPSTPRVVCVEDASKERKNRHNGAVSLGRR